MKSRAAAGVASSSVVVLFAAAAVRSCATVPPLLPPPSSSSAEEEVLQHSGYDDAEGATESCCGRPTDDGGSSESSSAETVGGSPATTAPSTCRPEDDDSAAGPLEDGGLSAGAAGAIAGGGKCIPAEGEGSPQAPDSLPSSASSVGSVAAASGRRLAGALLGLASSAASFRSSPRQRPPSESHHLVRILFLRGLSFVYFVAFLVARNQNKALIGDDGITPCRRLLWDAELRGRKKVKARREWIKRRKSFRDPGRGLGLWGKIRYSKMGRAVVDAVEGNEWVDKCREVLWDRSDRLDRMLITVLWLARDRRKLDPWLDGVAEAGMAMAAVVFVLGAANVPLLFGLWLCQRSIMSVGGLWYSYGWEPQLAELGFHALFAVPLLSLNSTPAFPVPLIAIWAIRWYLFRIMMGAGLIKMKSRDPKWKFPQLNAMHVFYETQPVPNPFSKYFHAMPGWWHKFEVLTNHFVELLAPWLLVLPGLGRGWRLAGGLIQIAFQAVLIMSGNLSFLNWLTAMPAILCLDDAFVSPLFSSRRAERAASTSSSIDETLLQAYFGQSPARQIITCSFAILIATLSLPVIQNLLAERQVMNASFDKLRLVNTYGAFGTVSSHRDELIIESAVRIDGPWREYHFRVKPGDVYRKPRWISPYHYRLDWQIWIACCTGRGVERSPWLLKLMLKLLQGDEGVLGLLEGDPWAEEEEGASSEAKEVGKGGGEKGRRSAAAAADHDADDTESADDSGSAGEEEEEEEEDGESDEKDAPAPAGRKEGRPKYIRIVRYRYKFNYDREEEGGDGGEESGGKGGRRRPYWKRENLGKFFPRQGTALTEEVLSEFIS